MDIAIGIVLVLDVYAIVYYRLLVRHFLKTDRGVSESTFGALLTPPPWRDLSPLGRKYAKRYYGAVVVLVLCLAVTAATRPFPTLQ